MVARKITQSFQNSCVALMNKCLQRRDAGPLFPAVCLRRCSCVFQFPAFRKCNASRDRQAKIASVSPGVYSWQVELGVALHDQKAFAAVIQFRPRWQDELALSRALPHRKRWEQQSKPRKTPETSGRKNALLGYQCRQLLEQKKGKEAVLPWDLKVQGLRIRRTGDSHLGPQLRAVYWY